MREPFGCWGGQPKKQKLLKKTYCLTQKSLKSERENRIEKEIERIVTLTLHIVDWLKIQILRWSPHYDGRAYSILTLQHHLTMMFCCKASSSSRKVSSFFQSFSSQSHFSLSLSLTSPISLTTPLTLELFFNIYIVLYSSPHGHTFEFIIFVFFHSFNSFVLPHHTLNFFILKSPLFTFCPHAHSPQKHIFIIIVIIFVAFLNEKLK